MNKSRYILLFLCAVQAGSSAVLGQNGLYSSAPSPFERGNETHIDSRQSETFFQSPLVREYKTTNTNNSSNNNSSYQDDKNNGEGWSLQIGSGLDVDKSGLEKTISDCRKLGATYMGFWESLASIQSVSKKNVEIVVQNRPNRAAIEFSEGSIYLNRPADWKSDSLSLGLGNGSVEKTLAGAHRERAAALKQAVLAAQLYQNGYSQVFSLELIDALVDCFAYPGTRRTADASSASSGATDPGSTGNLTSYRNRESDQKDSASDWVRFSLYASDGLYARDFFRNISDRLKKNSDLIQYLTSNEQPDGTVILGSSLPVLERGRDQAPRYIPGVFDVQKRTGSSLDYGQTTGNQSLRQKTRTGFGNGNASAADENKGLNKLLEISDLVDFESNREAYAQWIANPESNAPAIRVSANMAQTPANRLPEEAQRMISLIKLAHRSQVSFLKEEVTPAVFNHTNYQESLKPKMVLTRTKTLEQVRTEMIQAVKPNTFLLDAAGNLKPVRTVKELDSLFTGNGALLKVGQDHQGEFLTSVTAKGDRFRVRWVDANLVSDENVSEIDRSKTPSPPVILIEKITEE